MNFLKRFSKEETYGQRIVSVTMSHAFRSGVKEVRIEPSFETVDYLINFVKEGALHLHLGIGKQAVEYILCYIEKLNFDSEVDNTKIIVIRMREKKTGFCISYELKIDVEENHLGKVIIMFIDKEDVYGCD